MKILMLTPYLPYPPASGGQVRSLNLLKNLGKKHQIFLVALIKNEKERRFLKYLEKFCQEIHLCQRSEFPWTAKNILKSIFGLYPFLIVRNSSPEAKIKIAQLLSQHHFDLIHAETFYIMPHLPKTDVPVLLAEQTIEYQVYQHFVETLPFVLQPFFYLDVLKLKFWEKHFWKKANIVVAVSNSDKKKMSSLEPNLKIKIIPNGAGEDLIKIYSKEKKITRPIFLYQGNFSWLQNTEAAFILAKKIFPKIKEKVKNCLCYIAGQKAKEKIGHLEKYGVKIIDIKPSETKKVKELYKKATIFLAPIFGPGGTRLKILGAMAAGIPVISSPIGIEGLELENKSQVLVAKNYNDFVKYSLELIDNPSLYQKIRIGARKLIEEKYYWPKIASDLEKIYLELIKKKYENRN